MTASYIAWDDGRLRPLLYGVMANISRWSFQLRRVHGHACTACGHQHVCLCIPADQDKQRELLRCPWCTPWMMEWAPVQAKPKKKPARRRTTRRSLQPVP